MGEKFSRLFFSRRDNNNNEFGVIYSEKNSIINKRLFLIVRFDIFNFHDNFNAHKHVYSRVCMHRFRVLPILQ